ncbi:hypothetical protein [Holospora undulata]|uniref:hypothetical protein n=1 Tax=Holospora undulata TaxID=1169117 RepID=UPI0012682A64|nr:hypothetical protein [Holospora undulata]
MKILLRNLIKNAEKVDVFDASIDASDQESLVKALILDIEEAINMSETNKRSTFSNFLRNPSISTCQNHAEDGRKPQPNTLSTYLQKISNYIDNVYAQLKNLHQMSIIERFAEECLDDIFSGESLSTTMRVPHSLAQTPQTSFQIKFLEETFKKFEKKILESCTNEEIQNSESSFIPQFKKIQGQIYKVLKLICKDSHFSVRKDLSYYMTAAAFDAKVFGNIPASVVSKVFSQLMNGMIIRLQNAYTQAPSQVSVLQKEMENVEKKQEEERRKLKEKKYGSEIKIEDNFTPEQKQKAEIFNAMVKIVSQEDISDNEKINQIKSFTENTLNMKHGNINSFKKKFLLLIHPDKVGSIFPTIIKTKFKEMFSLINNIFDRNKHIFDENTLNQNNNKEQNNKEQNNKEQNNKEQNNKELKFLM